MKVLVSEQLSPHRYKDNHGYLICTDCILARTGKQEYTRDECFGDGDEETKVEVERKAEDVFNSKTLASFENVPITIEHPNYNVDPDNHNSLSVGFVRDIHKGKYDGQDVMMGTIVLTDSEGIEKVENNELTNLSCGYDCDIDDTEHPHQFNIRGNHIALCELPRAGITHIQDSVKDDSNFAKSFRNSEDGKCIADNGDNYIFGSGKDEAKELVKILDNDFGGVNYLDDKYYAMIDIQKKLKDDEFLWVNDSDYRVINRKGFIDNLIKGTNLEDKKDYYMQLLGLKKITDSEYSISQNGSNFEVKNSKGQVISTSTDKNKAINNMSNLNSGRPIQDDSEYEKVNTYTKKIAPIIDMLKKNYDELSNCLKGIKNTEIDLSDSKDLTNQIISKVNDLSKAVNAEIETEKNRIKEAHSKHDAYSINEASNLSKAYGLTTKKEVKDELNTLLTLLKQYKSGAVDIVRDIISLNKSLKKSLDDHIRVDLYGSEELNEKKGIGVKEDSFDLKEIKDSMTHSKVLLKKDNRNSRLEDDLTLDYESLNKKSTLDRLDKFIKEYVFDNDLSQENINAVYEDIKNTKYNGMGSATLWGRASKYVDNEPILPYNEDREKALQYIMNETDEEAKKYIGKSRYQNIFESVIGKGLDRFYSKRGYETYFNDSLKKDDIVKKGSQWTNKGKEGTHGTFATKKEAREQQKAMFANGFKDSDEYSYKYLVMLSTIYGYEADDIVVISKYRLNDEDILKYASTSGGDVVDETEEEYKEIEEQDEKGENDEWYYIDRSDLRLPNCYINVVGARIKDLNSNDDLTKYDTIIIADEIGE